MQKDYSGKFNKFSSWCCARGTDPYSISLTQVADFFADFFDKGLQFRTIAGYRPMMPAVIQPIDNVPIGKHPNIIRLLKGNFIARIDRSNCGSFMLFLSCVCYAFVPVCLWIPSGHLLGMG